MSIRRRSSRSGSLWKCARGRTRRQAPAFNAMLDLVLSAPSRVYVRGRGIDAELGGDLRLTGTLQDPIAIGAFEMRRGRLTVIGTRLDFTRGRLTFTGDLTPGTRFRGGNECRRSDGARGGDGFRPRTAICLLVGSRSAAGRGAVADICSPRLRAGCRSRRL